MHWLGLVDTSPVVTVLWLKKEAARTHQVSRLCPWTAPGAPYPAQGQGSGLQSKISPVSCTYSQSRDSQHFLFSGGQTGVWETGQGGGGWGHETEGGAAGIGTIGDGMKSWSAGHGYRVR